MPTIYFYKFLLLFLLVLVITVSCYCFCCCCCCFRCRLQIGVVLKRIFNIQIMKYSIYNLKTTPTFYHMVSKYFCELSGEGFFLYLKFIFINQVPIDRFEGSVLIEITGSKSVKRCRRINTITHEIVGSLDIIL